MPSHTTKDKIKRFLARLFIPGTVLLILFIFDFPLRTFVRHWQNPLLNHAFDIIKYGGNILVCLALCAIFVGIGKCKDRPDLLRTGKVMFYSLILSGIIILVIKPVFNIHPKPEFYPHKKAPAHRLRWGRFPSGDSDVAFVMASALSLEFPVLTIPTYTIAVLVGVERVYFNLHFFSDVFAGAWLGIATVFWLRQKYFCGRNDIVV